MSNEIIETSSRVPAPVESSFSRAVTAPSINAGAVAIESERAIAEAQGQLTLAKRFPRSVTASISEFMETCASPEFAAAAFYSVPNRGSGPSIRFAEEAARCYGNFQYGHRELSRMEPGPGPRDYGRSEVEVYAWDMQNNNYSKRQITVIHVVDTKNGPRKLTDQTDIDNKIANVASKQMRGRILALLPKHMVAKGQEACKLTNAGGNETPLRERLIKMVARFAKFGVKDNHLTTYLGHSVDDTTIDELNDLIGIFNALQDGSKPSEFFKIEEPQSQEIAPAAAAIAQQVKQSSEQQQQPAQQAPRSRRTPSKESKPTESDSNTAKADAAESDQKEGVANAAEQQAERPTQQQKNESAATSAGSDAAPEDDDPF